ncbi:non-ribosomal peptide synthetase [Actinorugispora endophytica]|uniref:non-ribosomal peptide synthetase n=1 Tax=Actinorugispora endophytica TaxID=1605990 RepID=UPI001414D0BC|nr:non-ribosomal peptide synthetase [Actinorugispora endophytica]
MSEVAAIVAEVLGIDEADVDPGLPLTSLGLESFTAVRLRRRLRDDADLDLPLTAFLGGATVATVAAGAAEPGEEPGADDGFPLTPLQTAYWIGRDPAFPMGGVATFYYHEYDRLPGGDPETDLERLTAAWNRLVEHHPMLRMVVGPDGRQRVLPRTDPYRIAVTDLRAAAPHDAERTLAALRHEHSHQLRPADRWPLFDIRAAFLPDGRTRIQLGVDVLTLDLTGWTQVLTEWGTLFGDPGAALPESTVTFAEVLRRRRDDPGERARRERDREYWRDRAASLPPGPALPWTVDLAGLRSHRFTRHAAALDERQWSGLRERAAAHGLSPTGVLLAAFGLTLDRWGATDAFSVNATLFDRPDDPELRHLVGDFTSTVLVEMPQPAPGGWTGFRDYAAGVNQRFWTDLEHRSVSGVEVLRDAGAGGPALTHPVVFTSGVGLSEPGAAPAGWLGEEVFGVSQTPQVALDHIVIEEGGGLRVAWDCAEGALPDGFAEGMAAAHARLLRRLAAEPGAWTDPTLAWDPSFLPDEPLECEPFAGSGPLLDDPVRAAAGRTPDAPALLDSSRSVSHGELAERAARTGAALAAAGAGPGELVAVCLEKGVDQVAGLLGVMAGGAGYVPVEPSWPTARVTSVCEQAGVTRALVAAGSDTAWPDGVAVHVLDEDGGIAPAPAGAGDRGPKRPDPGDLAYAVFTSGSTGRPKGVAIEHRAARTTIDDLVDRFPLRPDDRMLALSAFSFDLSVHDVFGVMGAGAALVLPDAERQRDPGHWMELMARHRVTLWNTAPALMEMLVEYAEIDPGAAREALAELRLVFLSGDWIPVTLPDRLRALAPKARVVSLGGATEASIWSICHPIEEVDPRWPSIPYGRALRGQSFHVLDARGGAPRPVGEPGELHIGGDGLARGYVGDPVQTGERFIEHPVLGRLYHTGDMGRWRADGTIEFLGRIDRQVKIRGHRIELGEVESALDRLPGVRQAVAMSVRGPDGRPRLVAYLVESESRSLPGDEGLVALLRERVPAPMVPSRFVRMPALPVTDNGKIDYRALANPYDRSRPGGAPTAPPPEAVPAAAPPTEARAATAEPARERVPEPKGGLDALVTAAVDAGLTVSLRVDAGDLPAGRALSAAGAWVRGLQDTALPGGVTAADRLCADGLVEIVLRAAPDAERNPAGGATGPEQPPRPAPPEPPAGSPAAPRRDPEVERAITRVLGDLLDTDTGIDPTTAFFQLGATSLTLVLAHRRLSAELDPDLSVVDLFSHPTVRDLAECVVGHRAAAAPTGPPAPAPEPAAPARNNPSDRAEARRRARAAAMEAAG